MKRKKSQTQERYVQALFEQKYAEAETKLMNLKVTPTK
jgi:hypothetical protein